MPTTSTTTSTATTKATTNTVRSATISTTRRGRLRLKAHSAPDRDLTSAGTSRAEIIALIAELHRQNWDPALEKLVALSATPIVARTIAAHAISAVTDEFFRQGLTITARNLTVALGHLRWIDRANFGHVRLAFDLIDQAYHDAFSEAPVDRFLELCSLEPGVAVRTLTGALLVLTHPVHIAITHLLDDDIPEWR